MAKCETIVLSKISYESGLLKVDSRLETKASKLQKIYIGVHLNFIKWQSDLEIGKKD